LHALAAILLWRTLAFLKIPGAWLAAAIFALHPIEVESVAWITERKNVLSAVFYFASALAYLRFVELGDAGSLGRRRRYFYLAALVLFEAALLSKTVTCSLPAALLLVRWWKKGRLERNDILPLLPFFAMGIGMGLLTAWLEKSHAGAQGAGWSLTFAQRFLIAGHALWFYAGKLVWPAQLTFIYPRWEIHAGAWRQWLFPITAIAVVTVLWQARWRIGRGPLVAVLFFAGTLGPSLGFVNVFPFRYSFVADHFQYLAGIGLIVLCAAGLSRLPRPIAVAPLLVLGWLTWQQVGIYQNLETLWRDTLAKNPDCWLAHNNLGIELEHDGKFDEAFEHYTAALPLAPDYPETYNNLGNALIREGQLDEAMKNYRKAIQLDPNFAAALNSLGVVLGMKGNYNEAVIYLRESLRLRPNDAKAHMNLGNALKMQNNLDAAIREYAEALRLAPNSAPMHENLGIALEEKGLLDEAVSHYQASLRISPEDAVAHFNLGRALAKLGRPDEAAAQFKEALRLRPDYPEAEQLLQALDIHT
jgi:tetratricopeptide (TPR) repeat protein